MGKHEWMTRRTSRSRYPDVSAGQEQTVTGKRTRWRIGGAALWVAAGLVAGIVAVLWSGGAFAEPDRTITKIATMEDKPAGNRSKPSTDPAEPPPEGGSGEPGQHSGVKQKSGRTGMAPAGIKVPADAGAGKLVVHVAGAVKEPGIVTLQQGSRVHEAISAAGGPRQKAQLEAINLAATLQDGQQLYVPAEGEKTAGRVSGTGPAPGGSTAGATSGAGSGAASLVNINTADAAELSTLPGVGPVLSGRIVDWRLEHGPFGSVTELDAVSGIGEKMLATLGDLVTV